MQSGPWCETPPSAVTEEAKTTSGEYAQKT